MLLRLLLAGERLDMPQSEPLPSIAPGCGALRVRAQGHSWRIVYRIDSDAILILEVYSKTTRKIPKEVIDRCKQRKQYDGAVTARKQKYTVFRVCIRGIVTIRGLRRAENAAS
jgi:phage-related protein